VKNTAKLLHVGYALCRLVNLLHLHGPNDNAAHILLYQIGECTAGAKKSGYGMTYLEKNNFVLTKAAYWREKIVIIKIIFYNQLN
jgi:hypothetical protein